MPRRHVTELERRSCFCAAKRLEQLRRLPSWHGCDPWCGKACVRVGVQYAGSHLGGGTVSSKKLPKMFSWRFLEKHRKALAGGCWQQRLAAVRERMTSERMQVWQHPKPILSVKKYASLFYRTASMRLRILRSELVLWLQVACHMRLRYLYGRPAARHVRRLPCRSSLECPSDWQRACRRGKRTMRRS